MLKILSLYFILLISIFVASVQINYIKVPMAVKNDTNKAIILDCNYSLRPDDTDLVVKWYLNDRLVYQWISPQRPLSFGLLKSRVDLRYKASDDLKTKYRAMKIINPTSDLAGEYKCLVSTFNDEDFAIKNLIVFVPEKSLEIIKSGFDENVVNFTCLATEVYPAPKLLMYKDGFYKNRLSSVQYEVNKHSNGRYSVHVLTSVPIETLPSGSMVRCELRIPGTGYVKIKNLHYYSEGHPSFTTWKNFVVLIMCLVIIHFKDGPICKFFK